MAEKPNPTSGQLKNIIDLAVQNSASVDQTLTSQHFKDLICALIENKDDLLIQTKSWIEQLTFEHEFNGSRLSPYLEVVEYLRMFVAPEIHAESGKENNWQEILTCTTRYRNRLIHFGSTPLNLVKDEHATAVGQAAKFLKDSGFEIVMCDSGAQLSESASLLYNEKIEQLAFFWVDNVLPIPSSLT